MRVPAPYGLRLALPLGLFFAAFFAVPLFLLLGVSLQDAEGQASLGQYARFLGDSFSLGVLLATLRVGLEVTVCCLILGYPLALLFIRAPGWARSLITLVVLLPLLTSVVVRTFAWIVILGRQGIVNTTLLSLGLSSTPLRLLYTEGGLVAALTQVQLPLMVLPLITALGRIEPNLADASAALGAGSWRTFLRVTLPLSLPGLLAGSVLCFAGAITSFITQSLVGGGQMILMPAYLYQQAISLQNWPYAAAISVIFLVSVLVAVWAINGLGRLAKGVAHA